MGMFDEIYVDPSIAKTFHIQHGELVGPYQVFQTKSFECVMDKFVLKFAEDGSPRLFRVDDPDESKLILYTDQEIEEHNASLDPENNWLDSFWIRKSGDGYFPKEDLQVENRKHRSMGELPHGWINMGTFNTKTRESIDYDLKFTDGILVDHNFRLEVIPRYKKQ